MLKILRILTGTHQNFHSLDNHILVPRSRHKGTQHTLRKDIRRHKARAHKKGKANDVNHYQHLIGLTYCPDTAKAMDKIKIFKNMLKT